ncbi:MAG: hypothetical protein AB7V50_11570, partial [Vampirovibrionia bacterium]
NDDDLKNKLISETLIKWNVLDYQKILKAYDLEFLNKIIRKVEQLKPENYGAYFRILLKSPEECIKENNDNLPELSRKLQVKYWKHKPSGKTYKIKPDIGNHLLIKYFSDENKVMILETGFIDELSNFDPVDLNISSDLNTSIVSRQEIIATLKAEGKNEEVRLLSKIWKKT